MRKVFRVLLFLYLAYLVACASLFLFDPPTGGPYNGIGKAVASIGAGLPWTLLAFLLYPPQAGPKLLYALSVLGALANVALLAHFAGWRISRRPDPS